MTVEDTYAKFEYHIKESDEARRDLREQIAMIKDNHLAHLSGDVNELKNSLTEIKSDVKWVKIIGAFVVLQSITILIKLFL